MSDNKTYRYACLMRPPVPGAVPKQWLIDCTFEEGTAPSGHHHWGIATYNHKLPKLAIYSYELEEIKDESEKNDE